MEEKCQITQLARLKLDGIVSIKRIQNWRLYRRYELRRRQVQESFKKYTSLAPNDNKFERQLFHGTNNENAESISRHGFSKDYAGTNLS